MRAVFVLLAVTGCSALVSEPEPEPEPEPLLPFATGFESDLGALVPLEGNGDGCAIVDSESRTGSSSLRCSIDDQAPNFATVTLLFPSTRELYVRAAVRFEMAPPSFHEWLTLGDERLVFSSSYLNNGRIDTGVYVYDEGDAPWETGTDRLELSTWSQLEYHAKAASDGSGLFESRIDGVPNIFVVGATDSDVLTELSLGIARLDSTRAQVMFIDDVEISTEPF